MEFNGNSSMTAAINQSAHSHHSANVSRMLDKSSNSIGAEAEKESPDDTNQLNASHMNVPPEEDAREQIEVEPALYEVLRPDCQQCLTAI